MYYLVSTLDEPHPRAIGHPAAVAAAAQAGVVWVQNLQPPRRGEPTERQCDGLECPTASWLVLAKGIETATSAASIQTKLGCTLVHGSGSVSTPSRRPAHLLRCRQTSASGRGAPPWVLL